MNILNIKGGFRRNLLLVAALLLSVFFVAVFQSSDTHATGETFRWDGRNRIRMEGGDFRQHIVEGSKAYDDEYITFSLFTPRMVYRADTSLTIKTGVFGTGTCSLWLEISELSSLAQQDGIPRAAFKQISQNIRDPGVTDHEDCEYDNSEWGGWELPTAVDGWHGIIGLREGDRPEAEEDELDLPPPDTGGDTGGPLDDLEDIVDDGGVEEVEGDPVCNAGALGWFLCPFAVIITEVTGGIANLIEGLLIIEPLTLSTDNPIFSVWSLVRNLANVGLILVFLIVIISQITSFGLSNYGIKRILPRLVIAAILLNVSYFICALAIDAFNLLGAGVQGIFGAGIDATLVEVDPAEAEELVGANPGQWLFLIGSTLAALAAAAYTGILPLIMTPLAIGAAAIVSAFIVLVLRQVLVVLLIVASPLAFLSWLTPGTTRGFDMWRKTFIGLLMTYPIIMALFYGSAFVASIINTAGIAENIEGAGEGEWIAATVSFIILALPIVLLPATMRLAGGLGNRFKALQRTPTGGLFKKMREAGQTASQNSAGRRRFKAFGAAYQVKQHRKWADSYRGKNGKVRQLWTRGVGRSIDKKLPKAPGAKTRGVAEQRLERMANAIASQESRELSKALSDAINGAQLKIKADVGNDNNQVQGILDKAIKEGDLTNIIASTGLLVDNKGITQLQDTLRETLARGNAEELGNLHESFREYLPKIDAMAPELSEFAITPRTNATSGKVQFDDLVSGAYGSLKPSALGTVRNESATLGAQYISDETLVRALDNTKITMIEPSRKTLDAERTARRNAGRPV